MLDPNTKTRLVGVEEADAAQDVEREVRTVAVPVQLRFYEN